MPKLEKRKKEIMGRFSTEELSMEDSQSLSQELGAVQEELESSEMRWLELMEKKEG